MKFTNVEILKECAIAGQHHAKGDVVTVTEDDAKDLYRMGRAQPAVLKDDDEDETPAGGDGEADSGATQPSGTGRGRGRGRGTQTNGQ